MSIPNPEEFIFKTPLYEIINWKEEDEDEVDDYYSFEGTSEKEQLIENIVCFEGKVDGYCVECGKETTYRRIDKVPPTYEISRVMGISRILVMTFTCSRNEEHRIELFYKTFPEQKSLVKIGQIPSLASLLKGNVNKYRKILGNQFSEYSKAIGLVSHGIGIGSFVYLRRIFENLIEEAHQLAIHENKLDEEEYRKSRMNERIVLLKDYLPEFLVKNSVIYGILSKGIHELSEQECLEIFPAVKLGIELILDDKIKLLEQKEKEKSGSDLLTKIASKISEKK